MHMQSDIKTQHQKQSYYIDCIAPIEKYRIHECGLSFPFQKLDCCSRYVSYFSNEKPVLVHKTMNVKNSPLVSNSVYTVQYQ